MYMETREQYDTRKLTEVMAQVDVTSGCWIWTGKVFSNPRYQAQGRGYGRTSYNLPSGGRIRGSHRTMHYIMTGEIHPTVRHVCNEPRCVRPDHLIGGTHSENSQDMVAVKRQHTQKVSVEQVREIRERYAAHEDKRHAASQFAREYGTSYPQMRNIITGRSFPNV